MFAVAVLYTVSRCCIRVLVGSACMKRALHLRVVSASQPAPSIVMRMMRLHLYLNVITCISCKPANACILTMFSSETQY